MDFCPLYLLEK